MLLQSDTVGEGIDSQPITLHVINSKLVGMTIGHFIYFLKNKAINVRVSYRVRVRMKSFLKYVISFTVTCTIVERAQSWNLVK